MALPNKIDAAYVIERLEEAGATLMALPSNAPQLGQRVQTYGYVAELIKGALPTRAALMSVPDAASITRMDEAFGWLAMIPNQAHRRMVAARSLTKPGSGLPVFSWAKLGAAMKADPRAVQAWHGKAVELLAGELGTMADLGRMRA